VSGNLFNASTRSNVWDTGDAFLGFNSGGAHTLQLAGADLGSNHIGYDQNYSWGTLQLGAGQSLVLQDGNATAGGALYVDALLLATGLGQIASIIGNGLAIYYDPQNAANAYLNSGTYALSGGGYIAPVIETLRITSYARNNVNGAITLQFDYLSGRTHTIQYSSTLTNWANVTGATLSFPAATTAQWTDDGSLTGGLAPIRFYRVQAE
jgi:hypothetical protein